MKIPIATPAKITKRTALSVALLAILPAFSVSASAASLPPEIQQGAIAYRSGGVGQDEAQAMEKLARQYPLQLEFVERERGTGHEAFIADVDVSIHDHGGKQVLQAKADGPFLLARLPAGAYIVDARYDNISHQRRVIIPAHGTKRVVFGW